MNGQRLLVACGVVLIGTALSSTPARAERIYQIVNYPADQNGHTIDGTITTDGTIGSLRESNLLAYEYTITGPNGYSDSSSASPDDIDFDLDSKVLRATPNELIFRTDPQTGAVGRLQLGLDISNFLPVLVWRSHAVSVPSYSARSASREFAWQTFTPMMNGTSDWTIGRFIPEPGTVALVGLAFLAILLQRMRKAT